MIGGDNLKKINILIISIFLMTILFNINIHAEENENNSDEYITDNTSVNKTGHYVKGVINAHDLNQNFDWFIHVESKNGVYIVKDGNNFYVYNSDDLNNAIEIKYYWNLPGDIELCRSETVYDGNKIGYINFYHTPPNTDYSNYWCFVKTSSVPIFDKSDANFQQNVDNYKNNGDTSGATNSDNIGDYVKPEYSEDIELPKNFHVVSGYKYFLKADNPVFHLYKLTKDLVYNWSQSVDTKEYSYDYEVNVVYVYYGKESNGEYGDITYTTGWVNLGKNIKYNGSKNITLTIKADDINSIVKNDFVNKRGGSAAIGNKAGDIDYISRLYLRVRNRNNNNCSHYVQCDVDFVSKTAKNAETDEDGYTVDEAEYDNDDATVDQEENDSSDRSSQNFGSLSSIISYIKDGFGLLGSGGILTLMANTFLYLPNSIWTILKFFVSMMVAIALVKLVKDVIL